MMKSSSPAGQMVSPALAEGETLCRQQRSKASASSAFSLLPAGAPHACGAEREELETEEEEKKKKKKEKNKSWR